MVVLASLALGQQASQPAKQTPPPAEQAKPAPLFGGKLGIRSSRTTKESATLGFNGIDPSGKVDQKMLSTPVAATDQDKAKKMGEPRPSPGDLAAFASEGGLKTK